MDWLTDHSAALNLIANLGMLVIWVVYLQVFLFTYLRARRPRVNITRGRGSDMDALCLVSNMSQEPVYPQSIYCTINGPDGDCSATITDRDLLRAGESEDTPGVTSQGPLGQGQFMSLGPFRRMLEITLEQSGEGPCELSEVSDQIEGFEIMVISAFGGDDLEIAATRAFRVDQRGDPWAVIPVHPQTRQISSRRERKQIRRQIIEELRPD
ncbi:hypothetical protein ACXN5S_18005 [Pseudoroseicyclus sp. H15]